MGKYRIAGTEEVTLGRFSIVMDQIDKDGKLYPYSYVRFKECVGILPIIGDKILLIEQYRHSLRDTILEIPGGSIDVGENPEETAIRELREETGYECREIHSLGTFYPSPGASDEKCHLFYVICGAQGGTCLEPLEMIKYRKVFMKELDALIEDGSFRHSMGLIAWMRYRMENNQW